MMPPTQTNSPIKVGIAGLGRSGWNIHAKTLSKMPDKFQIVALADGDSARLGEAAETLKCRQHPTLEDLARDREVELVVVATPNRLHGFHTLECLKEGKHVVVEKPAATSCEEMDRILTISRESGRLAFPFQQRRYEAHFKKVREIAGSGRLGRILNIRLCWHGFKRRWDWQTLREFGGGTLNNNGPHLLDHAMEFLPDDVEPEVFCDLQRGLSLGDAEDHVKLVLKAQGAPTIDLELSDVVAFPTDRWLINGTSGGLTGTETKLHWKWVDWSQMSVRNVERLPDPDRNYNSETLTWLEERWEAPKDADEPLAFYADLYRTVRLNAPQIITAESVRRRIAVMEKCHRQYSIGSELPLAKGNL